jgi:hypothetical protein
MYFQHSGGTENRQGIKFTTRHAFLVLTGFVAAALGLRQVLESGLKVKQKVYQHSPVDKVLQALVGILGGCRFMKDLNRAAAPVAKDRSVARAWGQEVFAHFSTVCRTLRAFTTQDVQTLADLLGAITKRRLEPILCKLAGPDGRGLIVIDVDLSGQKVRGETTQYTGTAFGHIQGQLARGYQIAAAILHTGADRFSVAGQLKPGNATNCLLELIPNIEAVVGRPRRRVEFVQQCADEIQKQITQMEHDLKRLGKGRGMPQRQKALQSNLAEQRQRLTEVKGRLAHYHEENAENPTPRRIALRADSAFGTAQAIQVCLELGYELVMKRYSVTPYRDIFDAAAPESWTASGKKRQASEVLPVPGVSLLAPFPLRQVAMQRTDVDGRVVRSIVVTTLPTTEYPLLNLVRLYEARQSIEAAFQECKHTFHFGTPRLRSAEANSAFTQLVLFAFNLVRWTNQVTTKSAGGPARTGSRLWVWTAAHCAATVTLTAHPLSCTLRFSRQSGLAGLLVMAAIPPDSESTCCPKGTLGLFAPTLS